MTPDHPPGDHHPSPVDPQVDALRRFNRFYTRRIGLLSEGVLDTPYALTPSRVLYELAHRDGWSAAALARELGLDPGYLSRILKNLQQQGLLTRERSGEDARTQVLALTPAGRDAFAGIDRVAEDDGRAALARLGPQDRQRLCAALATVQQLLDPPAEPAPPFVIRPHHVGDVGWVIHRHGVLYAAEYHWDISFEALVAEIGAKFIREFDPAREACWIAERNGEIVGSVFIVRESDEVAKLRLMYVEPHARGLGIGRRLVGECIAFARRTGYRRIVLWTNSVLLAARKIYASAGFELIDEEPHHSFGHDLIGETWRLEL